MTWVDDVMSQRAVWERAPSAHNTQPARLTADGDRLVLGWDPQCELTVADPSRRDLWLSLGAFAESVVIAAAEAGHTLEMSWSIDARRHVAGALTRVGTSGGDGDFGAADLLARRTARGPYAAPALDAKELASLMDSPQSADVRLSLLPPALVEVLLPEADRWSFSTPAQVEELRRWLRLDRKHPAYTEDGLTFEALAMSDIQARALRIALSPTGWRALSRLGGPSLLAAAGRLDGIGSVLALHTSASAATEPAAVAEAGRALLRTWLAAGRMGLSVHPLSQLIDCPTTSEKVYAALPCSNRRALSVFRIGRPIHPPVRSARRGEARVAQLR